MASVSQFHERACKDAAAIGDRFAEADNGPTAADLAREVDWLLDDAVAALRTGTNAAVADHRTGTNAPTPTTWKALKRSSGDIPLQPSTAVMLRASIAELERLWASRLEKRVPFQYLVASAHWRDLVLGVQPGVLIPRPETELMVDFAEEALKADPSLSRGPWADLGTGSGALAIAIARSIPAQTIHAVDKSPVAIAVASRNVQRYGLQHRVAVREGSWFEPLADFAGRLAGVVSNPPYIPSQNLAGLQKEVGAHEPRLALDGGSGEGLEAFREICAGAARGLRTGGLLALETNGWGQAEQVGEMLEQLGAFADICVRPDLSGVQRFVTARRL